MSKYYATIHTDRNKTISRRGHSYISTHTRGWNTGIEVECSEDSIKVYQTGGSNNSKRLKMLYKLELK